MSHPWLQVRQLLLDPAVNREFKRIHKALEDKTEEAKRLHEELQGTHFSHESKQGRMLVAKCRTLAVRQACLAACLQDVSLLLMHLYMLQPV